MCVGVCGCGGGGGGADGVYSERLCCRLTSMQAIKTDGRQCASPFGWIDQLKLPTPGPSEGRFQSSPVQNSPNPKSRKKIARYAHLTSHSYGGKGAQSFPSPRRWIPSIRTDKKKMLLDVSSWLAGPFCTCCCLHPGDEQEQQTAFYYPHLQP